MRHVLLAVPALLILGCATGPSVEDVAVEKLSPLPELYVALRGETFASLDEALAEKGYGNVTAADLKPKPVVAGDRTYLLYADEAAIPAETTYMPMTPAEAIALSKDAMDAIGVVIEPWHLELGNASIDEIIPRLPERPRVSMEIRRKTAAGGEVSTPIRERS